MIVLYKKKETVIIITSESYIMFMSISKFWGSVQYFSIAIYIESSLSLKKKQIYLRRKERNKINETMNSVNI